MNGGHFRKTTWLRAGTRRGSTYLIVLFTALIVSVVGFAAFRQLQVQENAAVMERDWNEAGVLATSASELALAQISRDYWWREVFQDQQDDQYSEEMPLGRGSIRWQLEDPVDGDISDDDAHPVRVVGRGRVGISERIFSVLAWPTGQSLDVLRSALHASGEMQVGGLVDVRDGPLSTNSDLKAASGQVLGDVQAESIDDPDRIIGSIDTSSVEKKMPNAVLHSVYKSLGTEIPFGDLGPQSNARLQHQLISPLRHPTDDSSRNASGLYWIKMPPSSALTIRDCRIEGTLLVELSYFTQLKIGPNVVWKPARPEFPVLQVYTKVDWSSVVDIECDGMLSERVSGRNFNPADTPYYGEADSDTSDEYPASIRGLIHVIRDVGSNPRSLTTIRAARKMVGSVIVDGKVHVSSDSILVADPGLYAKPPLGYTTAPPPNNVLANGDMESGTAYWSKIGSNTDLDRSDDAHSGDYSIEVERSTAASGIYQDITAQVTSGEAFGADAWLRMSSAAEEARLILQTDSTGEGVQRFESTALVGTDWTRVQVEHLPTWTGTLLSASWRVITTSSGQTFQIDDCVLRGDDESPPVNVRAVPGTWRAEMVP